MTQPLTTPTVASVVPSAKPGSSTAAARVHPPDPQNTQALATIWARKYVNSVVLHQPEQPVAGAKDFSELLSPDGRAATALRLKKLLTQASAAAWAATDALLADEIPRHGIYPDLHDPREIAAYCHTLFQQSLNAYAESVTPQRLSVVLGKAFGDVRRKYTARDPRILSFVSIQFHNTGKKLLERLDPLERSLFLPYLKVMDDHMYMPLRDAYEAAASHTLSSSSLIAVQNLLPISTAIAHTICNQVGQVYPGYHSYSGSLKSPFVRTSSIRDVEMFQVYLCLCVLEDNVRSVKQELFPLCVMLYPQLRVSWTLVQQMLQGLKWEIHDRLSWQDVVTFLPYLHILMDMFSSEVFQDS